MNFSPSTDEEAPPMNGTMEQRSGERIQIRMTVAGDGVSPAMAVS